MTSSTLGRVIPLLTELGGVLLELPDSTQQPRVLTLGQMARRVANRINAGESEEIRGVARDGILWAFDYANISYQFMFGLRTEAAVAITEGDTTIALTTSFFGISQIQLLLTAESIEGDQQVGDVAAVVPYMPYERFSRLPPVGDGPVPLWWSARNTFVDKAVEFWPRADADAAADWTFRLIHYTPVEYPDSDTDVIAAPRRYTQVIVSGASYYLLKERRPEDPFGIREEKDTFETMLNRFKSHEQVEQGRDHGAWTIGDPP